MNDLLTSDEIEKITGSTQPATQEKRLRAAGLNPLRVNGGPVILTREALTRWNLGEKTYNTELAPEFMPDEFDGMSPINWLNANKRSLIIPLHKIKESAQPWPKIEPPQSSSVYFLFLDSDLRYVGKSKNPYSRLFQHEVSGKRFNQWAAIPVPELLMDMIENAYISWLMPPDNLKFPYNPSQLAREAISGELFL